jgi:hypothetical protein
VSRPGLIALAAALLAATVSATSSGAGPPRPLAPYSGLGAWVSIYDTAAWRSPERVVQKLVANRVHTLFLQTSNYRQDVDVVRPAKVGRFLDAAHAAGISVVGWYLPSLASPSRDLRRALAGIRLRSAGGNVFDSYALDIEATKVRSFALRNVRALQLAAALRRSVPAGYALGAITIAPIGNSPSYWPDYPYRELAASVDVFLPMAYFTARTHGAAGVSSYTAANLRYIRARVGESFPIHPIGGETRRATLAELRAFLATIGSCRVLGTSLWEYGETSPAQWPAIAAGVPSRDASC